MPRNWRSPTRTRQEWTGRASRRLNHRGWGGGSSALEMAYTPGKMWLKAPIEERDEKGNRRRTGGQKCCGTPQVILSHEHAAEGRDWMKKDMTRMGLTLNEAKSSIRQARREGGRSFDAHQRGDLGRGRRSA